MGGLAGVALEHVENAKASGWRVPAQAVAGDSSGARREAQEGWWQVTLDAYAFQFDDDSAVVHLERNGEHYATVELTVVSDSAPGWHWCELDVYAIHGERAGVPGWVEKNKSDIIDRWQMAGRMREAVWTGGSVWN